METRDSRRHVEGVRTDTACADKRFGAYKPEEERSSKPPRTIANRKVEALVDAWETMKGIEIPTRNVFVTRGYASKWDGEGIEFLYDAYYNMCYVEIHRRLKGGYAARDIQSFILGLPSGEESKPFRAFMATDSDRLGLFLSGAVNCPKGRMYSLGFDNIGCKLANLGFRNDKGLVISDGRFERVGMEARSGMLIVRGNAGNFAGAQMSGGRLVIEGDAGTSLGEGMSGGEISVEGGIAHIGEVKGGKIFHKGKLVLER